jgi:hypothetical protein
MLHELGLEREIFAVLLRWDFELARAVAREGCQHCGGPLHQGNYARKPRGGWLDADLGDAFALRHSLCCGRGGCRRRALPPSLRFLGRRVYIGAVVVLASVCAQIAESVKAAAVATRVPQLTLARWGRWWREAFPALPTWAELRARFAPPPPDVERLPESLLRRAEAIQAGSPVSASLGDAVLLVARSVAPLTTCSTPDGSRFVRAVASRLSAGGRTQEL